MQHTATPGGRIGFALGRLAAIIGEITTPEADRLVGAIEQLITEAEQIIAAEAERNAAALAPFVRCLSEIDH